ncbi:MAG TPA: hypothetical protein VNJ01_15830 [Bacteriovoracaceae bacterium]|nr:hypothetical protein [Bacteriovoracaceae bacterium]
MPHTYQKSKELYYTRLRVPKDESYFVYFIFESNEGLCYFSTADESLKSSYRDIEVRCPVEATENLKELIKRLQAELRLDVMEEKVIQDS